MCSRSATILAATVAAVAALCAFGVAAPGGARAAAQDDAPRAAATSGGRVFLTVEEALALAFEGCEVTRSTEYFNDERKERVATLAKGEFDRGMLYPYAARKDGELVGTAYVDTHQVRTLSESLFFVVAPDGTLSRIELLSFAEPPDYIPSAPWYAQLIGKPLDDELFLKKGVRNLTGATLTARATVRAARRVLAAHRVIGEDRAREERERREREKEKEKEREGEPPQPQPQPQPEPQPQPQPQPQPRPQPDPTPTPTPRPEPEPQPHPEPRPTPRPEPEPGPGSPAVRESALP